MNKVFLIILFLTLFFNVNSQVCGTCTNADCGNMINKTGPTADVDLKAVLNYKFPTPPPSQAYKFDSDPLMGKNGPFTFSACYEIYVTSSSQTVGIAIKPIYSTPTSGGNLPFTGELKKSGQCSSAPITPNNTIPSVSSTTESIPSITEWTNLPIGTYVYCINTSVPAGFNLKSVLLGSYVKGGTTTSNECSDCNTASCDIAGPYSDFATAVLGEKIVDASDNHCSKKVSLSSSPVQTPNKYTSYYKVKTSSTATMLGIIISNGTGKLPGETNPCGAPVRTATLYPITGCASSGVSGSTTSNLTSFFNREWTGLTAGTEYIIKVETTAPSGCQIQDQCASYYSPGSVAPLPCGKVGIAWRNAANTPSASDYNNCADKNFEVKANSVIIAEQDIAPGFLIDNDFGKINLTKIELDQGQTGSYINTYLVKEIAFCSPNVGYNVRLTGSVISPGSGIIRIIDHATGQDLYVGAFTNGMVIPINAGTLKGTAVFSGPGVSNYRLNYPSSGATNYNGAGYGFFNPSKAGNGTHTISYSWNNGNQDCGTATIQVTVAGCTCTKDNGTQTIKINNTPPPTTKAYATNSYGICYDDVFTIETNGAIPNVDYAAYIGAPSSNDPSTETSKYTAFYAETFNKLTETSKGNTSAIIDFLNTHSFAPTKNTVWWVPISTATVGGYNPACFQMDYQNESYKVTYLNDIKITATEVCASSKVTLKFEGGGPEFITGKKYNITTNKGSLSAASVSSSGGTIDLTGLSQNDNYVINVTDEIGCTKSYTGTYTCACTAPTITGPSAICDLTTIEYTSNGTLTSSDPSFASVAASGTANKYNVSTYKPTTASTNFKLTSTLNGCTTTKDITINPLPTATLSAPSPYTCGDYTVTANTGAGLTYEWYKSPSTTPIAGQTSSTFTATSVAGNGSYTVKVSDGTCSKTSSPLNISYVACNPCVQPTITAPIAKSDCEGTSVTYTVLPLPSGSTASSYQWQVKSPGGSWTDLTGEINGDLTLSNITNTMNGNQYQVIVKEATNACPLTSTPVGLTVNPLPTFNPTTLDICEGEPPVITYPSLTGSPDKIIFDAGIPLVPPLNLTLSASPFKIIGLPVPLPVNTYSGFKVKLENSTTGCKSTDITIPAFKVQATLKPSISAKSTSVNSVTFQWSDLIGLNTQTGTTKDSYTVKEFVCSGCTTPGTYVNGTGALSYNSTTSKWEYLKNGLTSGDKVFIEVTPVDIAPLATPSCYAASTFDLVAITCNSPIITKDILDVSLCEGTTATPVSTTLSLEYNSADATTPATWEILTPGGTWSTLNPSGIYTITGSTNVDSKLSISDIKGLDGTKYRVNLKTATVSGSCNTISHEAILTVKPLPVMTSITDKLFCPGTIVNDPLKTTKDIEFKVSQYGTPTFTWVSDIQTTGVSTGSPNVNDFASFTTLSPTNDVVSKITVTPTLNQCVGQPLSFNITVKPTVKPIFSTPVTDFSSVKFVWTSSSIAPDFWEIDTAVAYVSVPQPPLNMYKTVTPILGTINNYTVSGINSTKKAYINVKAKKSVAANDLFCPVADGYSAIPTPCVKPTKPLTPIVNPVCEGSSINVTGVLPDALANFQWKISTDGGTVWNDVSTTDFGSTGTTNELTTTTTKTYMNNAQVKLVLTDKLTGQCTEESDKVTLVINKLPTVKLIQPAKTSLCVDETEVSATVQPLLGLAPMKVDYTFNGVNFIDKDISTLDIKFGTSTETNHSLSIDKVVDANGCVNLLTGLVAAVSVHKNPTPEFTVSDTIGCLPLLVNFIDISGETYKDVTWDFGTGTNSSKDMGTTTFTYQKEGDYTVTYSVENMNGCKSENVKVNLIHVKSPPKAMISSDRNLINIYENVVRFDSKLSQNATFYKWDFGDNSSISNEQLVNHKYDPNTPGKFKVYLIVSNSPTNMICSDTAITWIDFPEEVIYYIPNTFTPNGDEFNNTFQPIFSSGYDPQNYSFIIFDRWGQIVFESKNPTVGWDGTFGDKLLGNDTFVWKLGFKEKANDNEHYTTGHVNLVK